MSEKREFSKWYKERIENNPEFPPGNVWGDIQDELDVSDTWEKIDRKFRRERRQKNITISGIAAAAIIALLLLIDTGAFLTPAVSNHSGEILLSEEKSSRGKITIRQSDKNIEIQEINKPIDDPGRSILAQQIFAKQSKEKYGREKRISITLNDPDKISPKEQLLVEPILPTEDMFAQLGDNEFETEEIEKQKDKTNYYLGFSGQISSSLMLSNKTLYSINQSPYSQVRPGQSNRFGVLAGIRLSERFSTQTEFYLNSIKGQTFREYQGGELIENQIQLSYSSLQLLTDYKFIKGSPKLPFSHHILIGAYGSYLKNVSQSYLLAEADPNAEYKEYDAGLIVGYSLQAHLIKNINISADFRLDPGIINIYEGSTYLPKEFNKTFNSALHIGLSFSYNLSK